MLTGNYLELYHALEKLIPVDRLIHDELRTLAYGTDASFYRLVPKLVVRVESEAEVIAVLGECRRFRTPVTFRAAGTSLSGQSITDSVLVALGSSWRKIQIHEDGDKILLQPGVIGAHANIRLLPCQRKIGPDPASINSAMIGGIAANNASGMCCGTAQNSYNTLAGMRIIFGDGSLLDTNDTLNRRQFLDTHPEMISRLSKLAGKVRSNGPLADRIRRKFKMKNTTGYSLNALVDFEDPIEILQHLMIGSEGTLGFIAEVTYRTVPDLPHKASALMLFSDLKTACEAIPPLKASRVAAVELMDRASLHSVETKEGMPDYLRRLDSTVAALLAETRAWDKQSLQEQVDEIVRSISHLPTVRPISFTADAHEYTRLWNIRKGLFPSVGAMRATGMTVIIEDVCFPVTRLAEAALELQGLFQKHGYHEAIIFGHALEGNLHFVFNQDFNKKPEVLRYRNFMNAVARMVVHTYDGSLKAEHGTGRNMAPFVEMEWGTEAYGLMKEIKEIFDRENLINPGVILNSDAKIHLKNLKPLPAADPIVDKCIECGFCEVNCPSKDLTLTPRQRIVVWREISRLTASGQDAHRLGELKRIFDYQGEKTCATDGLCATTCPVSIDTGQLIKVIRHEQQSYLANRVAALVARNFDMVTAGTRMFLNIIDSIHSMLGSKWMDRFSTLARRISLGTLPQWNPYLPRASDPIRPRPVNEANPLKVVYLPSCLSRTMGISRTSRHRASQTTATESLLRKTGYEIIYPGNLSELCCGMAFASKGFKEQGDLKYQELEEAVSEAARQGMYPVLADTSPCVYRMKEFLSANAPFDVYEPVEFILRFLKSRLRFTQLPETIAIHTTCSSRKMGLDSKLKELAELCAERVIVPENVGCCGFAGDRGFSHPELNASALRELRSLLPDDCYNGYSTSKTCEIGLSVHAKRDYQSIVYLVDQSTEALRSR